MIPEADRKDVAVDGQPQKGKGPDTGTGRKDILYQVWRMINTEVTHERLNAMYDVVSVVAISINLLVGILSTFAPLEARYGMVFAIVEMTTVAFFALDYVLRLLTVRYQFPQKSTGRALLAYVFSLGGLIDLLSFLPYYLPIFFPAGAVAFRLFRVARILRLFRINPYYDSLNVICDVIVRKSQQLLSSLFIIAILMVASSLCMYSVEHEAQPEVFDNAFSGIWWASSALLTVGYGDIYPITTIGRIMGILLAFLGVGLVAIPTGIISAGFVEQYTRIKSLTDEEKDVRFVTIPLQSRDSWVDHTIGELKLPKASVAALVMRGEKAMIPDGNLRLCPGDTLVLGASVNEEDHLQLKEIVLREGHEWIDCPIGDLDISRQSLIVTIRRGNTLYKPFENMVLEKGDQVYLYHRQKKKSGQKM